MLFDPRVKPRSSALVAALRVGLVALAAGALVLAIALGRGGNSGDRSGARRYRCPMHSEVSQAAPGDCPICGMALEELDASRHVALPGDPAASGSDDLALTALRASAEATSLLRFSVAQARRSVLPGEVFAPAIAEADGTIRARLYRDELASLAAGETAVFVPAAPGATRDASLPIVRDARAPVVHGALAEVAFRAASSPPAPLPAQAGWVKLAYRSRDLLVVRSAAVLQSADGPYVLVFSAQRGTLARRRIEIGKEYAGMTAIVSGLRDKEFVVMANAFSFDAERRLQATP